MDPRPSVARIATGARRGHRGAVAVAPQLESHGRQAHGRDQRGQGQRQVPRHAGESPRADVHRRPRAGYGIAPRARQRRQDDVRHRSVLQHLRADDAVVREDHESDGDVL
eukprot:30139-Pelagococcus_subviridis.AAC.8